VSESSLTEQLSAARRSVAVFALGAFVLVSLLAASPSFAKPFEPAARDWEGLSSFVQLASAELGDARVVVTQALNYNELRREDGIVLVHPERTLDVESLASFMREGGRVVLLDDYGTGGQLLRHFGIERVPMPERPAEALRNNPSFALAEPASAHPVVADVSRLVTNHATGVHHPELSPVLLVRARSSDGNGGAAGGSRDVLLAQAGAVGHGRLLAVGDASVLINEMLRYPGNRAFARGIVRYAVEDDAWGARSGRLFVVANDFEQLGTFGDASRWSREWNERSRAAKDALAALGTEGLSPTFAYALAVLVGLVLVLWVGARAGRTHRPVLPRFVRAVPLVSQGGVAGHAAVLASKSAPRMLAMLEMKSALEEELVGLLGLEHVPSADVLLAKVAEARLLDAEGLRVLRELLLRMAKVETMVLSRRQEGQKRVRDREVLEAAETMRRLLATAAARRSGAAHSGGAGVSAEATS
jgi:hypothetical protein